MRENPGPPRREQEQNKIREYGCRSLRQPDAFGKRRSTVPILLCQCLPHVFDDYFTHPKRKETICVGGKIHDNSQQTITDISEQPRDKNSLHKSERCRNRITTE